MLGISYAFCSSFFSLIVAFLSYLSKLVPITYPKNQKQQDAGTTTFNKSIIVYRSSDILFSKHKIDSAIIALELKSVDNTFEYCIFSFDKSALLIVIYTYTLFFHHYFEYILN